MAGRYDKAQAASETGLFSRRDFFDLDAVLFDPTREGVEVGLRRNLEPGIVHPRRVRVVEDDAMAVKFVPGPEIDAAIGLTADLVQSDTIDIMRERRIHIGHPDLNVAGSQYAVE